MNASFTFNRPPVSPLPPQSSDRDRSFLIGQMRHHPIGQLHELSAITAATGDVTDFDEESFVASFVAGGVGHQSASHTQQVAPRGVLHDPRGSILAADTSAAIDLRFHAVYLLAYIGGSATTSRANNRRTSAHNPNGGDAATGSSSGAGEAKFYIGYSTDPLRRLRQHNGELANGAWFTKRVRQQREKAQQLRQEKEARRRQFDATVAHGNGDGPAADDEQGHEPPASAADEGARWVLVCCVSGFPEDRAALAFEWSWQHPTKAKALKRAPNFPPTGVDAAGGVAPGATSRAPASAGGRGKKPALADQLLAALDGGADAAAAAAVPVHSRAASASRRAAVPSLSQQQNAQHSNAGGGVYGTVLQMTSKRWTQKAQAAAAAAALPEREDFAACVRPLSAKRLPYAIATLHALLQAHSPPAHVAAFGSGGCGGGSQSLNASTTTLLQQRAGGLTAPLVLHVLEPALFAPLSRAVASCVAQPAVVAAAVEQYLAAQAAPVPPHPGRLLHEAMRRPREPPADSSDAHRAVNAAGSSLLLKVDIGATPASLSAAMKVAADGGSGDVGDNAGDNDDTVGTNALDRTLLRTITDSSTVRLLAIRRRHRSLRPAMLVPPHGAQGQEEAILVAGNTPEDVDASSPADDDDDVILDIEKFVSAGQVTGATDTAGVAGADAASSAGAASSVDTDIAAALAETDLDAAVAALLGGSNRANGDGTAAGRGAGASMSPTRPIHHRFANHQGGGPNGSSTAEGGDVVHLRNLQRAHCVTQLLAPSCSLCTRPAASILDMLRCPGNFSPTPPIGIPLLERPVARGAAPQGQHEYCTLQCHVECLALWFLDAQEHGGNNTAPDATVQAHALDVGGPATGDPIAAPPSQFPRAALVPSATVPVPCPVCATPLLWPHLVRALRLRQRRAAEAMRRRVERAEREREAMFRSWLHMSQTR